MFKSILSKIIGIIFGVAAMVTPVHYEATTTAPLKPVAQTPQQTQVKTSSQTATSTKPAPKKVVSTKIPIKIATKAPAQQTTTQTTQVAPTPTPLPDFAALNDYARTAVVNILCTPKGNDLSPISGTGIIITQGGVIMTNAHIAQYFLLKNYSQPNFIDCVIRTGSPAQATYHAELVYISPTWVANNKDILKIQNPTGTGENDFAFLHITDALNGSTLPTFNHIPVDIREGIDVGEPVLLVSYPAGFLGGQTILQDLSVASGMTTIQGVFTYATGTADLISAPGTIVSQKGSSGGAVIDKYSSVIGMITLSSNADTTGARSLYAITPAYINRDLQNELGISLADFLDGDISAFAQKFRVDTAPLLIKELTEDLNITTPAQQ